MRLSERETRTILAGAAVAAAILFLWALSSRGPAETGAEWPSAAALHARFHELAAQREATEAALARAREQEVRLHQRLLPPEDPAAAGAALTSLVERVAQQSGVRLDQRRVGESSVIDEALRAVPLEITLSADILGLRLFLYSLARADKTLTIDDLAIASLAAGTTAGARPSDDPPLRAQMTITGYASLGPAGGAP